MEVNDFAGKFGTPAWLAALAIAFASGTGISAAVYEKVRIPGLEGRIALQEKELAGERLQTSRAQENAAGWKKFAEDLSGTEKAATSKALNACSMVELVRQLRTEKSALESALGDVQTGRNNWISVSSEERDKRVAELRRAASDIQGQILAVSQCGK
ncbi:hypothetical protein [Variovorax boronicumulans]|uniref:hypothetical protein n=1 Tax=Variovorax boronicumulans TaxID=436515 RepID=UPI0012FD8D2C|nr:hypothetical protein [Variovorax boronicumulans]